MTNEIQWMPTWQLVSQGNEGRHIHLEVFVSSGIEHFRGHFPGFGVLPGVVQIDWAVRLARHFFQIPTHTFRGMEQIKFQAMVLPEMTLQLVLDWDSNLGRLSFAYQEGFKKYASGRLVWSAGA